MTMLSVLIVGLVASALAVDIPKPKLTSLSTGDLQLALEDIPGAAKIDVEYTFSGKTLQGSFNQKADGRWYLVDHDAKYNGNARVKFNIKVFSECTMSTRRGSINPGTVVTTTVAPTTQPPTTEAPTTEAPTPPPTTVGPTSPPGKGRVVFRDDFNGAFDASGWDYEVSMFGGYNWEAQAYVPDARNIFTRNGHLFIKPTLTTEHPDFNDGDMNSATMDMNALYGYCTNSDRWGCVREGQYGTLPPVMSGKIKSKATIKFGKVEVRARVPSGNWIWPAIWMMPRSSVYGGWPRSGEIDIMETRGNSKAADGGGRNHGVNEVGATMHWGPNPASNRFYTTGGSRDGEWSKSFHTYRLEWTVDGIQVFVDDMNVMNVPITQSFWDKGGFSGNNLWSSGTKAAPFDESFYLILNVAIGGTNGFFPDGWTYDQKKPWSNNSPNANGDIWNARNEWLKTWNGDDVAMEIDYVEMTQY